MNHKKNRNKKPWPTKDAMEQVYEMKLWGDNQTDYYSGDGSHHLDIVRPYVNVLLSFLTSFEKPLSICDLGCGDFNVGQQLTPYVQKYIGVDIVSGLIRHNKTKFVTSNLEFHCLDIAVANLPVADCAIVRQVLQHLSNKEVQQVVEKLSNYQYVIITEHLPVGSFIPNIDIISGQGIRLKKQSGLDVSAPPFNFKFKEQKELLSVVVDDGKGKIVTRLYTTAES